MPDLVLWMLGTAQRIGQALAVHWPWIDTETATAALGPNVIRVKGEGLRLNQGTSKTKEQVLDLPSGLVTMLLTRWEAMVDPAGPVFPDVFGGLRDPSNTSGDLRRALDLAGYEWVTSHVFRKTVATVLDDAGLSARHVADQLAHARPSMTQDRYMARRARNPRAKAAIEAMLTTEPGRRVVSLDRDYGEFETEGAPTQGMDKSPGVTAAWIMTREAAELAGRSKDSMRQLAAQGQFSAHRDRHGRWLFDRTAVIAYGPRRRRHRNHGGQWFAPLSTDTQRAVH